MIGRALLLFLTAVILTAFFVPRAGAHELPCFMKESSALTSFAETRGYGVTEQGLIKLGVNTNGHFILTVSPPGQPLICVFVMGQDWEWVGTKAEKPRREDVHD